MLNNSLSSLSSAEKEKVTTHDRTGKLQDLAVEYFQRAYGLGGRAREDHNELCEEAVEVTQCSRRAFRELIYGHSYQAILGPLRDMVPGYKPKLPKREQRELQMQELEQSMSGSPGSRDDILSSVPSRPSFKLSSSAPPFESPKMLPQPPQPKFLTTLTPNGRVVSPVGPAETSMSKPKLADRVLTSPERKPKPGVSPEPMDLPGSYSRGSTDTTETRSDWGSPLPWPTPSPPDRRERDTSSERREEVTSNIRSAFQVKADKPKEEKEVSEEKTRVEAPKMREERVEDRVTEEKEAPTRKEEVKETKFETTDAKHVKEEKENQPVQGGVIEEALRDKGARVSRQDKTPKSRTNRSMRSPQLTPSLFTSPLQPLPSSSSSTSSVGDASSSSSSTPASPTALLKLVRFKLCGEAFIGALVFCMLRQYAIYLADYPGRVSLQALWPLLMGSFVLFGLLLHRVLHSTSKAQALPMAIAADAEDYIEAWELLHVGGDSRELVHALQEVQIMLGSLLQGLDVFQPAPPENGGINHAVRVLDYLSVIHKKLAGEIGNTVLVMRLVDSLRRMRMSLLKLCLSSETALPLLEPLSASLVAVNAVCLLVVVEPGSALFEILVLPAFVFLFALLQLVLTHLDSPFSSIAPLNLDSLKYMQKRVQNRITQLQKAE